MGTTVYEKILIILYITMLIAAINPANGEVGDILINNENKLLESGKSWTLNEDYELTVTALDNERVLISLSKDGKEVHRKGHYRNYSYEYRNPTNISQLILRFRVFDINDNEIQLINIFQISDGNFLSPLPTPTPTLNAKTNISKSVVLVDEISREGLVESAIAATPTVDDTRTATPVVFASNDQTKEIGFKILWNYTTKSFVDNILISSDGSYIAGASGFTIYFFNRDGSLLWNYTTNHFVDISISSDGSYIAVWSWAGTSSGDVVYFFNREGKLLWNYTTESLVDNILISSDGSYIVGSWENTVHFFNREGKLLWNYTTDNNIRGVSISSNGYYIVGCWGNTVYLFNREGKLLWNYEIDSFIIENVGISSDGSFITATSFEKKVYFFNREGKLLWNYMKGIVTDVSISSDGSYMAAWSPYEKEFYFLNKEGKLLWNYKTSDSIRNILISSDGSYIVGSWNDTVYLFNREGTLLWNYETRDSARSISISSDGSYIATGSWTVVNLFAKTYIPAPTKTPTPVPSPNPIFTPKSYLEDIKNVKVDGEITGTNSFLDDFIGSKLSSRWIVINKNTDSSISLTGTGILRMNASPMNGGSDYYNRSNYNALRILMPLSEFNLSSEDWIVETKMTFSPTNNYQGAGIMVCFEDTPDSTTCGRAAERAYYPNEGGSVVRALGFYVSYANNTTYFRLMKKGMNYTGWYSSDGMNWILNGKGIIDESVKRKYVGLFVVRQPWDYNTSVYSVADFEYFKLTSLPSAPSSTPISKKKSIQDSLLEIIDYLYIIILLIIIFVVYFLILGLLKKAFDYFGPIFFKKLKRIAFLTGSAIAYLGIFIFKELKRTAFLIESKELNINLLKKKLILENQILPKIQIFLLPLFSNRRTKDKKIIQKIDILIGELKNNDLNREILKEKLNEILNELEK